MIYSIKKWWRFINCVPHTWTKEYSCFVLADGPNQGSICGIDLTKTCSKCGMVVKKATFLS